MSRFGFRRTMSRLSNKDEAGETIISVKGDIETRKKILYDTKMETSDNKNLFVFSIFVPQSSSSNPRSVTSGAFNGNEKKVLIIITHRMASSCYRKGLKEFFFPDRKFQSLFKLVYLQRRGPANSTSLRSYSGNSHQDRCRGSSQYSDSEFLEM